MERSSSLEGAPTSATSLLRHPELEQLEASEVPPKPPESAGLTSEAEGSVGRREGTMPPHGGTFPKDHLQGVQDLSSIPERAASGLTHPGVSPVSPGSGSVPDHSFFGSSTCSSLAGSSQESDEVFSDTEQNPASPPEKKRILRKTKSWKTFFMMVHWSLRRRSSWVQLAGHQGPSTKYQPMDYGGSGARARRGHTDWECFGS